MSETKTKSPGVKEQEDLKDKKQWTPDKKQNEFYKYFITKFQSAKMERNKVRPEFDELTYEVDYELNKRAANSYLAPKQNDDEVRINTGTTEKKIEVIINELLTMNLQPEVMAFDKDDNELKNLGQDFSDIVDRTNQIERDEDFWQAFIREMLVQRAVFVEEVDDNYTITNRGVTKMSNPDKKIPETNKKTKLHMAKKKLLSGLQVYLGDINLPPHKFQEQPYLIKYYRIPYQTAKAKYKDWKNWQYVKAGAAKVDQPYGYRMNSISSDEVEEIHYLDPYNDEFMITLNGVMMFDDSVPLPYEVTETRRYNMIMVGLKEMGIDFAYYKCLVASAKTLQGLDNEMIRLMVRKWRQILEPPMGSTSSKIYSKDIWTAGAVTYGMDSKDTIFPLNANNQGITSGEFNMYNLIGQKTEEFIGAGNVSQGIEAKGEQTATEVLNQQRQFIKQLGLAVMAFMKAKRDLTYLRLYNLLENFTSSVGGKYNPITEEVDKLYQKFTINDASFNDGKRGKKIVQFMDRDLEEVEKEAMFDMELAEEQAGRPTRLRIVNVKKLRVLPLLWFVVVNQREREGTALSKVMFKDKFTQAVGISEVTGRQINADKFIEEYELTWQIKDVFQKTPVGQEQTAGAEAEAEGGQIMKDIDRIAGQTKTGDQVEEGIAAERGNKPSLNTLEGQV